MCIIFALLGDGAFSNMEDHFNHHKNESMGNHKESFYVTDFKYVAMNYYLSRNANNAKAKKP